MGSTAGQATMTSPMTDGTNTPPMVASPYICICIFWSRRDFGDVQFGSFVDVDADEDTERRPQPEPQRCAVPSIGIDYPLCSRTDVLVVHRAQSDCD